MKKIIKVVAIIASVILTLSFIACSNPSSSDGNDPFAGTTWEAYTENMGIFFITTIKFSNNKTVDCYTTSSGIKTSIYSGPYKVIKNYLDVEGQYGAFARSQTFVIPNKDATSGSWDGNTFIKK